MMGPIFHSVDHNEQYFSSNALILSSIDMVLLFEELSGEEPALLHAIKDPSRPTENSPLLDVVRLRAAMLLDGLEL